MAASKDPKPSYHYNVEVRALLLCTGFVALLTVLSIRLIHVQHKAHEQVMEEVLRRKNKEFTERSPARRGNIQDRNGRVLATTESVSTLIRDGFRIPQGVEKIHGLANTYLRVPQASLDEITEKEALKALYYRTLAYRLAPELQLDPEHLYHKLSHTNDDAIFAKDVPSEQAFRLLDKLSTEGFKGLKREAFMRRVYTSGSLASHIIGFTNYQLQGVAGVEWQMDKFLAGNEGTRVFNQQDDLMREEPMVPGKHVSLTIDATFQRIAEDIVDRHFAAVTPTAISVIFAEPTSGEILAMVSRPNFSPDEGGNADEDSRRNYPISALYEPGSTFKIVTIGTGIDLGLASVDETVPCHFGDYYEDGWRITDIARGREFATVRDVLAHSLNTGTLMVAKRLPQDRYFEYVKAFGLGTPTGIRLPNEQNGVIRDPRRTRGRDFATYSFGYSQNATPLQILNIMNVVCNQGELVKPCIVREIVSSETGEVTARHEREVVRRVLKKRTALSLRNALIHAVEEGGGKRAKIDGFIVGGKTGTAEKWLGTRYDSNRNIASFLGFVATEVETPLIGIVVVDDPRNEGKRFGGLIAAPIFQEIAEAGMRHFGFRKMEVATQDPSDP